jgi:hypothetical protein
MFVAGLLALPLALSLGLSADKTPDSVKLKDGRELQGRVVYEGPEALRIKRGVSELEIKKSSVVDAKTIERSLKEALERYDTIRKGDSGGLADLARFCQARGLENEARNFRLRILLAGGEDEEAVEGAGARVVAKKVQVKSDDRWVDLDTWKDAKKDWKDAVEIRTAHFLVKTDLAMDRVLDAAIQLERHYLRFYEFLAPELVLYVFDETPEVLFYGSEKDCPPSWTPGEKSWFAPAENKLHVLATEDLDLKRIVHEATDLLLFNAFRRSSGRTGQIPPWSVAGFAEYFAVTAGTKPGDPWAPLGEPYPPLFRVFAEDPSPLPLKQLMRSSLGELNRGNDANRRSAEAYALVHYLMHGDNGAHRDVFFQQLRQAWKGRSIEEDLLKALDTNEAKLLPAVQAYAKAHSG